MNPLLTVRGVERRFDTTLALQATDLDVAENDFVTILGPSGCGKSTLLRIVAELIGASSGIGHMITDSQALLATDQIIFGIIVIGLIGLVSDLFFKVVNRKLFPWAQLGRS